MQRAQQDWIVRKRDGRSVPFELSRIQNALTNAFRAELNLADVQPLEDDICRAIEDVTKAVIDDIASEASKTDGVDVERIQF